MAQHASSFAAAQGRRLTQLAACADHPAPAPPPSPPPFLPHRNADGSWSVSNTFIVCAVVLAVCLLFSTIALAMSKKKIKAQAFTARISTSGVATTSIYDIPVEPAQRVSGAAPDSPPRPNTRNADASAVLCQQASEQFFS